MSGVTELNLNKYLVQLSTMDENYVRMAKKKNSAHGNRDNNQKETKKQIKEARQSKYNVQHHHHDR